MTVDYNFAPAIEEDDAVPLETATDTLGASLMSAVERITEVRVPVDSLVPWFHLRMTGTHADHVQVLADAAESVRLPPILVQKRGMHIIDGMHRVEVAKLRGERDIRARIIDCSDESALVLAVKSNTLHGLPLTRADRISSGKRMLGAHPDWSDRKIAEIAGLSAKSIASLRNSTVDGAQFDGKRLGRDGKRRPVVAAEGRLRAIEFIRAHPEASLRQIARQTGISLGTAQNVREKIRREGVPAPTEPSSPATHARPAPSTVTDIRDRATANAVRRVAWATIRTKLVGDPTLRYTEGGRAFLRWMNQHASSLDEWREFSDAIPERWRQGVRQVAVTMSEEWRAFAHELGSILDEEDLPHRS